VSQSGVFPGWWVVAGAFLAGAALCFVSFVITTLAPEPARWLAMRKASP